MCKYYLALGLTCLMTMFVTDTAEAAFIEVDGYSIVFDDRNNLYWVESSPVASGIYENSLAFLDLLNVNDELHVFFGREIFWGTWRIANQEDMTKLWTYDAEEISTAFIGTSSAPYYIFGRYDEVPSPEQHYTAGIFYTEDGDLELSALSEISVGDNESLPWLGCWIVADPAPVPLPASVFLFGSGIAGLIGLSLTGRKK